MLFVNSKKNLFFFCIQKVVSFFLKSNIICGLYKLKSKHLELEAWATPWNIYPVLNFLKKQSLFQFNSVIDIITYDLPTNKARFLLIYNALSVIFNYRFLLVTKTNNFLPLISIASLFRGSSWMEREIFNLFGIFFLLHLDLRIILTDYGFKDYPLRKDFPITGFIDIIYNDTQKQITKLQLGLIQKYRKFQFNSNWLFN
jgi:NADH:ubiquinone oxidoreductase subunit C